MVVMFCLVIFACAILALQPWFLGSWQRAHNLYSVGGLLGYLDICTHKNIPVSYARQETFLDISMSYAIISSNFCLAKK